MLAAVAPSTRVLAGQRLAACSNGQRTTMKSKSTYQARSWGCGRPGAAVLGLAACRPTTAGRALAPPRRPRHPASTSERHNVGGQPAQRACRGGPALVHRRRRSPAVPVLPGLRASPSAVCVLILLASALRFPALQVMVVVGDDEPQDNALKRFRREVMSAGKQREQSAMHHPAAWQWQELRRAVDGKYQWLLHTALLYTAWQQQTILLLACSTPHRRCTRLAAMLPAPANPSPSPLPPNTPQA